MKVTEFVATHHEISVTYPIATSAKSNREFVFVELRTDEGIFGCSVTGGFLLESIVVAINRYVAPVVRGGNATDIEGLRTRVSGELNPWRASGVIAQAISCLDVCLWDVRGKLEGRSVAELFGGSKSVKAYRTFGPATYSDRELVDAAIQEAELGVEHLKMVVGAAGRTVEDDARRVRLVRDAVGSGVSLMIDANCMLSLSDATKLAAMVEPVGVTWFEEPVYGNDIAALRQLAHATSVPLAAGQGEGDESRFNQLMRESGISVAQPNPLYCGGYTVGRRLVSAARDHGLRVANGGGWPRFNLPLMAAAGEEAMVEFHVGSAFVEEAIFDETASIEGGRVKVPVSPGLGLEPNRRVLDETRTSSRGGRE